MKYLTLNSKAQFPILGLGTWLSAPGKVKTAVSTALSIGYRHIDGAHVYENEKEIGEALAESSVPRSEIWLTSKLWLTYLTPQLVRKGCLRTLSDLQTPYLDLYLIHWPMALEHSNEMFPKKDGKCIGMIPTDFEGVWKEMEKLVEDGLVKNIGVSNFNTSQLEKILKTCSIPPAVNQVEMHPYLPQEDLVKYCAPGRPGVEKSDVKVLMEDPVVVNIAEKYKKTPAQVLIRYQIERGISVVPKSVTPARIQSNFEVFDFKLTPEDMQSLANIGETVRYIIPTLLLDHPDYPF